MRVYLHIPRTGGMTRRSLYADDPEAVLCGHHVRLSDTNPDDEVIVYFRHPVQRFLSAYAHLQDGWVHDIEGKTLLDIWPDAECLAIDIKSAWPTIITQTHVFDRQTKWIDTTREYTALRSEGMPYELRLNASIHPKPQLAKVAVDRLLDWYAGDLALWEVAR